MLGGGAGGMLLIENEDQKDESVVEGDFTLNSAKRAQELNDDNLEEAEDAGHYVSGDES